MDRSPTDRRKARRADPDAPPATSPLARAQAAAERYRRLLETVGGAFASFDRDWRYIYVNERGAALTGHRPEDLHGQVVWEIFPHAVGGEAWHRVREAVLTGHPVTFEDRTMRPGTWYEVAAVPHDQGISVFVRDVSERRRTEQELARRTAELERSNTELEEFAYVSSHDLKEPLRAIASCCQLLDRRCRGRLGPEADECIAYIVGGVERMHHLLDDLLAYSKVGSGGMRRLPCDTGAILEEVMAGMRTRIEETGAVVTSSGLPIVAGDPTQLGQLLANLVGNAIKFRDEAPPRVHVSARPDETEWVFCVDDNGIGIDSVHAERVFGAFQRLHGSHQYPGSGIGLAICRKVVERHGGRIWVERRAGPGAALRFTLPR